MSTIFLTGASGFLGRAVTARLRAAGHVVVGLHRGPGADRQAVIGDVTRPETYAAAMRGADAAVHLAAVTGRAPRHEYARVNVDGTARLIESARQAGVPSVLFCSTIAVTFPDIGAYPYAASKARAETLVSSCGLRTTTIRPTIIAGPGSPVMARLASLAALPVVPVFGTGQTRVQPILVDDLAEFIAEVIESNRFEGETLELGGRDIVTIRDVLGGLRRARTDSPARFLPVPLGLTLPVLRVLERALDHRLPLTVGQLATFRFDGVAKPNTLWERRRDQLAPIDRLLART